MTLGEKIRSLRAKTDWSLRDLAERSGVGFATLSRIETGKLQGNITTYQKIAGAFGISLTDLCRDTTFGSGAASDPTPVTAHAKEAETFTYDQNASVILLTKQVLDKKMMPQLILLQPSGKTHVEQSKPGSEKWIFVLQGMVEVKAGERSYPLSADGTLYFDASIPHQLSNMGNELARCISVTTPVGL